MDVNQFLHMGSSVRIFGWPPISGCNTEKKAFFGASKFA
ncbi:hypothetical protein DESC_820025 [Desulfosarcina cetonica]|nr:hypothetical protein DESC_820025 [Desulfosarcina cetonica]